MGSKSNQNLQNTYGRINLHREIGGLIRHYSTNKTNIYDLALQNLTFSDSINVLDLGCGFGQFSAHLKNLIPNGSNITGIDPLESNRKPFLDYTNKFHFSGIFHCHSANLITELKDNSYDLIISGFSLYFFSELLPEIARVLKSDGIFLSITHSKFSLIELLDDIQYALDIPVPITAEHLGLDQTLADFNSQNGDRVLKPYFNTIDNTVYQNQLVFHRKSFDHCVKFVKFKLNTVSHDSHYHNTFNEQRFKNRLSDSIKNKMEKEGSYRLNKTDAIFRCRQPIKRKTKE
ncbi:MAG: class I SAM-dependent methyltransferase [Candidatus Marinimicrobia bacterium]|nr:class I SAM-dependent methyltransferase [Candidatus Neomarinimicrobiota bacterium]MBL7059596.1 class I SAM-dependent methyltransferase [Candidatus Neomarinimicrobiota bacterium]